MYGAAYEGTWQLYLRSLDGLESKAVPGTQVAANPFFSPDGQWLGFLTVPDMKKVSLSGGAPVTIAATGIANGATWSPQGNVVYGQVGFGLRTVPESGGDVRLITHLAKGDTDHRWPSMLPGGKAVVFSNGSYGDPHLAAFSIEKGALRDLGLPGTQPIYARSGHLIYAQNGDLMAVPFDPVSLEVRGQPVLVVKGVSQSAATGAAQFSVSDTGTLAHMPGGLSTSQGKLVWVDRSGEERPAAPEIHDYDTPRISPDGERIAVSIDGQIWIYDIARESLTRLASQGVDNNRPVWTPDGRHIAFYSDKDGALNIYWQSSDGSGPMERLTTSPYVNAPTSFSPDGKLLTYNEVNPTTRTDLSLINVIDRKTQSILRTEFNEGDAEFSPDGHWIAYVSDETGRNEIYVRPYPAPGGKTQISAEGGTEPMWNRNGRELFYRNGDKMMAADVQTRPGFSARKPRVIFEKPYRLSPVTIPNYDVSADGQRFLMVKPSQSAEASPTQINIVLNWFEELKQRAPADTK